MNDHALDETINRTIHALNNIPTTEIDQLSIQESAFLLKTHGNSTEFETLRSQLAERARRQLHADWIKNGDLFEVFLTLNALWKHDTTYITGEILASAVRRLVESEVKVGGPYYSGNTIQIAANLQISSFVRRVAKPLPNLEAFLNESIYSERFVKEIKDQPYLLYLLPKTPNHLGGLQRCAKEYDHTLAYKAVQLMATHNSVVAKKIVNLLCHKQQIDGFWKEDTFSMSSIVITALICSILTECKQRLIAASPSQLSIQHQEVIKVAKQLLDTQVEPLHTSIVASIDAVCMVDKGYEITLLPYFFIRSLKAFAPLTDRQCHLLGAANLYGWIAYGIYDDFMDNEGVPSRLPVANCAMRYSLDCFQAAMPAHRHFQRYISKVFTKMDAANAWELANCRFVVRGDTVITTRLPQYQKCTILASRSFAHVLGPMAALVQHSYGGQKNIDRIESAFRHYLIAKQLADDLYDWIDDTKAGRASYVVTAILRDMRLPPGEYSLSTLLPAMQKTFRRTVMTRVCSLALHHTNKAKWRFAQNGLVQTTNDIFTLLDTLERTLKRSADEYAKSKYISEWIT